jgi:UDP-N-acetylmuramate dehydrogenase
MAQERPPSFAMDPEEGEVRFFEPLSNHTTLRIGGPAQMFVLVRNESGLSKVIRAARQRGTLFRILGKGSNVLVADDGLSGFTVMLAGAFLAVEIEGDVVSAGGGASLGGVCAAAARAGLSGIEPITGIPSSIGGAVRINAGAYGGEMFDVLESVRLMSPLGEPRDTAAAEIPHDYRWTKLCETGEIVCRARLRLRRAELAEIQVRTRRVREKRRGALPAQPNAGSIFKNPPGQFAGKLLEDCGLKGHRVGGAEISRRHANVIVNVAGARAADVLELMKRMRTAVREKFDVELAPEVELLGLSWP